MISLLLLMHVALAIFSLFLSGMVVVYAKKHSTKASKKLKSMWYGTIATLSSGVLLAILSHSPLGSTCMSLFGFLAIVTAASLYQRRMLASNPSVQ